MLKYLLLGFFIKFITSLDDALTRVAIGAHLTSSQKGRRAFIVSTALVVSVSIIITVYFSSLLDRLVYANYIAAVFIFFIAIVVYIKDLKKYFADKIKKLIIDPALSDKFSKRILAGSTISFAMAFDDIGALAPLFIGNASIEKIYAIIGIAMATVLQIFIVLRSTKKARGLPGLRYIAAGALVLLGSFVLLGFV